MPAGLEAIADVLGVAYMELIRTAQDKPSNGPENASTATAPTWRVPYRRNPNLIGRDTLLRAVHQTWRDGQPAIWAQAFHGLGGVGKTQLAVEYAYRYASDYDTVWWLQAETESTLIQDYVVLAQALNLPEQHAAQPWAAVTAVHLWLEQHQRWLLIFDNADIPQIPPVLPAHVMITRATSIGVGPNGCHRRARCRRLPVRRTATTPNKPQLARPGDLPGSSRPVPISSIITMAEYLQRWFTPENPAVTGELIIQPRWKHLEVALKVKPVTARRRSLVCDRFWHRMPFSKCC